MNYLYKIFTGLTILSTVFFFTPVPYAQAAGIAFGAVSGNHIGTGSPFNFTSATAPVATGLVGLVFCQSLSGDNETAITWGGVAGTLVEKQSVGGRFNYLWIVVGIASGASTVSLTNTEAVQLQCVDISYSGAKQSGQPDSSNQSTSVGANPTIATTVIANNSWMIMEANTGSSATAGAGTTVRGGDGFSTFFDSNAGLTPGSQSLNITMTIGTYSLQAISLAPLATVTGCGSWCFFTF